MQNAWNRCNLELGTNIQNESFTKRRKMSDSFMQQINEKESDLPYLVNELAASGLPLLLYGAGNYAWLLYNAISKKGLSITDIVVTSTENNQIEFMGHEVKAIDEALQCHKTCIVLIAFAYKNANELRKIEDSLLSSGKVAKVFCFDVVSTELFDVWKIDYNFLENNQHDIERLYNTLSDDLSRNVLIGYFNQRISGKTSYLRELFTNDQYFPDVIKLEDNEVFIDCGAYNGDTIACFIARMKSKKISGIYAFEPDSKNYSKLISRGFSGLISIPKGCYSEATTLRFNSQGDMESAFNDAGSCEVEVDAIDNVINSSNVSFIKMDVEGSELMAIEGAQNTISVHKPKLAISVYHKKEDLVSIPKKIIALVPEYKLYLRAHSPYSLDVVLYAIFQDD